MAPPDPKAGKAARRRTVRITGGLKAVADAKKFDESLILGPVQKHVVAREARDRSRRQDIIHPSEMSHADWCPRATYLRIKNLREGGEHIKEAFGFQSLSIFQHGHEVHDKWQKWLWEMGELWGAWRCRQCDHLWYEVSPHYCPKCWGGYIKYEEIPLDAEREHLIVGSADGGVPSRHALMEFKTVGAGTLRIEAPDILRAHTHTTTDGKTLVDYEGLWRGITRPFPAHQRQGQIYLHICKLLGLEFDQVVYIYESKFHQGSKEFVVQRRESLIEPLLDAADSIQAALDTGAAPPACPKGGCKHCQPNDERGQGEESSAGGGATEFGSRTGVASRRRHGSASARTTGPTRRTRAAHPPG